MQDDISLSYLNKGFDQYTDYYPLFENQVVSGKDYVFSENCMTQLMITNHYDNQIVIDKIILEAEEVEVDYSPILNFAMGDCTEEGVSVYITNIGWGNAQNLKIALVGVDKDLEDYFKKEALEFEVPVVEAAEQIEVPLVKNSDLLGQYQDGTVFEIEFEVECQCEGTLQVYGSVVLYILDGKIDYLGCGDSAGYVYGIKIDTNNHDFVWEENIIEFIDSGETLVFPICFFPDKSCSLTLKISFEIVNDGRLEIICLDSKEMRFAVSSIVGWNGTINCPIEDILFIGEDGIEVLENSDYIVTISYPSIPAIRIKN